MKITVVGTGYVGLVTGTCLAELGNDVTCVEIDQHKLSMLKSGKVPIYEPDLEGLFAQNIAAGRLHFTDTLAEATPHAELIFLALPTPQGGDGAADLSSVLSVAAQLGPLVDHYVAVVTKSTVPVGTADEVRARIAASATAPFDVVSNPEFLREGFAVRDFMEPDRVVVGTDSERARKLMADLYGPITADDRPILWMDVRSSELTKYAANTFLAMKVTFINEIANLCEHVGANVEMVRRGIGSDARIAPGCLAPGIGYGGSCFPKDVQALAYTAREAGFDFKLIKAAIEANARQRAVLVKKVRRYFNDELEGKTFALWGLSFKPDTDDIREAAALEIIKELREAGANVQAFDPAAMDNVRKFLNLDDSGSLRLVEDKLAALDGADALLIATEWPEFRAASLGDIKQRLLRPAVFDGRNIFDPEEMRHAGFHYESIGRPIL